ncbi:MAG: chaperone modulator CbpM [Bacteroidetes bacterium]|nr:chaperone modulator CbpM [Bacteroidota bacterium]
MENEHLIAIEEFCNHYKVEPSFIYTLVEFRLIEIVTVEEKKYLLKDQIREVEKMIRMHYDLDINIEGIEAISHLLQRLDNLQEEVNALKNRIHSEGGQ